MLADDESAVGDSTALPGDEKQQHEEKEEERPRSDASPFVAGETDGAGANLITASHHVSVSSSLSKVQVQAVDDAFQRIFGYPWGTQFELPAVLDHEQRMLVKIFGPEGAACLVRMLPPRTRRPRASAVMMRRSRPSGIAAKIPSIRRSIVEVPKSAPSPANTVESNETETNASPRTDEPMPPPPVPTIQNRGGGGGAAGVDRLLSEIAGKPTVSTLSKTSHDWESFKTTSGLGDAIEEKAQSKDSFLNRQDFLSRVDHRRFEVEKQERDRERAQRGI